MNYRIVIVAISSLICKITYLLNLSDISYQFFEIIKFRQLCSLCLAPKPPIMPIFDSIVVSCPVARRPYFNPVYRTSSI